MSGVSVEKDQNGDFLLNVNVGQAPLPPEEFTDWFLPSKDELNQMIANLRNYGIGNMGRLYWTSSEYGATHAWIQSQNIPFNDSTPAYKDHIYNNPPLRESLYSRPCRRFSAPTGTYNLRDIGPAGGWIFLVETGSPNDLYYEASPSDVGPSAWSNVDNVAAGTSTDLGEGPNNCQLIINQVGHTNSAAKLCDDLIT